MEEKVSNRSKRIPLIGIQICFIALIIASLFIVYSAVLWIYEKIGNSFGFEFADVAVSFLVILIFCFILLGFSIGLGLYRAIRSQDGDTVWMFPWIKDSWICTYLWPDLQVKKGTVNNKPNSQIQVPSAQDIITRPRPGRIPMYSLEQWTDVVLAWEKQKCDTWRNPMKLSEFLASKLGTHADGSALVSDNTFYEWRKRVLKELQKQEQKQKEE